MKTTESKNSVRLANKLSSREIDDLIDLKNFTNERLEDDEFLDKVMKIHSRRCNGDRLKSSKSRAPPMFKVKFSDQLTPKMRSKIFRLFESNMKQIYMNQLNSKYSEKSKMKELFHSSSKFILITLKPMVDGTGEEVEDDDLVGFLMWRFDFEDTLIQNVKQSVTYCYELQIESDYFGLGFGSRLIEILSLISCRVSIRKIMLTVQIINESALKFYRHLSFEIDDISPSKFEQKTDYEILSKVVL